MTDRTFKCVKPYVFKSFPKDHHIAVGEVLPLEGYLMGETPVLKLDPVKHPSEYKHLDYCACCIQPDKLIEHFEEVS